jgi:hypothetical protein
VTRSTCAGAEIEGGELTLNLFAFMGGANIYVPDSVDLEVGGFSFMGGHEEIGSERPPRPGAPSIRIRVYNLMGGASIFSGRATWSIWPGRTRSAIPSSRWISVSPCKLDVLR